MTQNGPAGVYLELIARDKLLPILPLLHTTEVVDGKYYWHIYIAQKPNGPELVVPKQSNWFPLTPFAMKIE